MYKDYFGLSEAPFSIAPDPRYLYMSERHREALAHLIYGVGDEGGFIVLTGEVGTGKTTVCRCLLEQLPEHTEVALILNPKLTVRELLASICDELRIAYPKTTKSIKLFVDRLNTHLLDAHANGRHTVLIIDEAQNLSVEVLEQLRLLTNLETNQKKLLQIILLGQPELNDILARSDLRQLAQRITARYHLKPLSRHEVASYISHRLAVAGLAHTLFDSAAIGKIAHHSRGTPRLINVLCDRALLGTYAQEKRLVDTGTVGRAAREVFGEPSRQVLRWPAWVMASVLMFAGGAALTAAYLHFEPKLDVEANTPISDVADISATPPLDSIPGLNKGQGFSDLLAEWALDYDPGRDGYACPFAETQGLACLFDKGSIGTLLQLNRPALLHLWDAKQGSHYATIVGLEGDHALLKINGFKHSTRIEKLASSWQGDFTMLWRKPPHYQGPLGAGSMDEAVPWLGRQLALIEGRQEHLAGALNMDQDLSTQVQDFQLTHGLVPDGIVGPKTLILLNTAVAVDVPMLWEGPE
ncbi:MAG: AAA family ATPase [Mariprofundaceae bacterium]